MTSDGSVRLEFDVAPSRLTARTSDGSVLIAVPPDDTAYAVTGTSADGSRDIDVPTDPDATSHRMDVTHQRRLGQGDRLTLSDCSVR